ncbi:cold-shock protein [Streptomyces sp. HNM0575]|nr:cold-shock protein [Streptomyces sp. HNM0575]
MTRILGPHHPDTLLARNNLAAIGLDPAPSPQEQDPAPPHRRTGTVKWFNAEKGYGFIAVDGGPDVFVHMTALHADVRTLVEGQRAEVEITSPLVKIDPRHRAYASSTDTSQWNPSLGLRLTPDKPSIRLMRTALDVRARRGASTYESRKVHQILVVAGLIARGEPSAVNRQSGSKPKDAPARKKPAAVRGKARTSRGKQ